MDISKELFKYQVEYEVIKDEVYHGDEELMMSEHVKTRSFMASNNISSIKSSQPKNGHYLSPIPNIPTKDTVIYTQDPDLKKQVYVYCKVSII